MSESKKRYDVREVAETSGPENWVRSEMKMASNMMHGMLAKNEASMFVGAEHHGDEGWPCPPPPKKMFF